MIFPHSFLLDRTLMWTSYKSSRVFYRVFYGCGWVGFLSDLPVCFGNSKMWMSLASSQDDSAQKGNKYQPFNPSKIPIVQNPLNSFQSLILFFFFFFFSWKKRVPNFVFHFSRYVFQRSQFQKFCFVFRIRFIPFPVSQKLDLVL